MNEPTRSASASGGSPPVLTPGAETREVTLQWIPSASPNITRYDLFVGTSPNNYDALIQISDTWATKSPRGVYSYAVTLQKNTDYYLALRAYDGRRLSSLSNEIRLPAESSGGGGDGDEEGGGGEGAEAGAATVATTAGASGSGTGRGFVTGEGASSTASSTANGTAPAPTSETPSPAAPTSARPADVAAALASLQLDSPGRWLGSTLPQPLGTSGPITVSMWLRPFLDFAPRRVLFDVEPGDGSGAERITLSLLDGVDLELAVHDATGALAYQAVFELAPADDVWQHLAVVFDPVVDIEPRVYLDLGACTLLRSEWNGWAPGLPDAEGHVRLGGTPGAAGAGFLGRLGHASIWADALSRAELSEIHARGHQVDLRSPVGAYDSFDALVHYWRLGDLDRPIGYDLGTAAAPIDLDDPAGGVDGSAVVPDGPASLLLQ